MRLQKVDGLDFSDLVEPGWVSFPGKMKHSLFTFKEMSDPYLSHKLITNLFNLLPCSPFGPLVFDNHLHILLIQELK